MAKILIVEDTQKNLDIFVQILEDHYTIVQAHDGEEGLRLAAAERPDLILMDLSLPKIDGWEATRRLKADQDLRDIPVVALTAHAMVGDAQKARAAGCSEYLTKPIRPRDLLDTVRRFIAPPATATD